MYRVTGNMEDKCSSWCTYICRLVEQKIEDRIQTILVMFLIGRYVNIYHGSMSVNLNSQLDDIQNPLEMGL